MKHKILKITYLFLLPALLFFGCEEPEPTREIRLASYPVPTITFNDEIPDLIPIRVEDGFVFSLLLEAEGGLGGLLVNGEQVHTSRYGQLRENVAYTYVMPDVEFSTVLFTVVDQDGQTTESREITMKAEGRLPPIFTISDMGGALEELIDEPMDTQGGGNFAARVTSTGDHEIDSYTLRGLFRNTQERFDGAYQVNAVAPENGTALRITKHTAFAPNTILYFGTPIPDVFIDDIDADKRVYQFDIYYDNTPDPSFVGDLDFDLYLINFSKYKNENSGIYETYSGHIPSPNAWHTITMSVKEIGGYHTGDVATTEIDGISLKFSNGVATTNPYYIRNFRIVKAN